MKYKLTVHENGSKESLVEQGFDDKGAALRYLIQWSTKERLHVTARRARALDLGQLGISFMLRNGEDRRVTALLVGPPDPIGPLEVKA